MVSSEAVATMCFFCFNNAIRDIVDPLQMADNRLQLAHGRQASPHGHFVDFVNGAKDHAAMLESLGQVELESTVLNVAQLTGQCGDRD